MILEVTDDQIADLNDLELRTLVGYLCEREVVAHGHSTSSVTWGGHQNAGDGGLDVRIALPSGAAVSGYVPKPATGFQVKAQDMPHAAILKEMVPDGAIRPSIVDLANEAGAYVIVSSKGSVSDLSLRNRKNAMAEAVKGLATASSLMLEFYDRRRIASWINQHPGLVPWVRETLGIPLSGWRPFGDWSSSPAPLKTPYLPDTRTRLFGPSINSAEGLNSDQALNALRKILVIPKGVVRLVGLSGVGKTRFVQALFDPKIGTSALLSSDALYTDISDNPEPFPQEMLSRLIALNHRVVLVVDNCGAALHHKLAQTVASSDCRLSLITIEYDINDDEPANTQVFKLEPSSPELIDRMLEIRYPNIPLPSRRVIVDFSEGNARVAFAMAETAKRGESLSGLRDTDLFQRLFQQQKAPNPELLEAAKACALVYSFDGETLKDAGSELVSLAKIAGLTLDQLYRNVAELHRRQLVQKRSKWRAILPHALANRLAKRALEDIPLSRIEDALVNAGLPRLLRSFSRRVGYLHGVEPANTLVDNWFSSTGLLASLGQLSELHEEIFENVAPVNPAATLVFIERTAAANGSAFFGKTNRNADQVIRILASIAYDPSLFARSISLIKRFALAESLGETESAAATLRSLFWIQLSGTHATPAQRAEFIESLLQSTDTYEQDLGLSLIDSMLETSHFSPKHLFGFGAWNRDFGYFPKTRKDVCSWYTRALQTARTAAASDTLPSHRVRHVIACHIAELLEVGIIDEVTSLARTFAETAAWPEGWIGVRKAMRKAKTRSTPKFERKLVELEQYLMPSDLPSSIRAYVLSAEWGPLDVAEIDEEENEDGSQVLESRQRVIAMCRELGSKLAISTEVFATILPELLQAESQKTRSLGEGLALGCASLHECWRLLRNGFLEIPTAQRRSLLLSGFLVGAMTRSAPTTNEILDSVLENIELHHYFVELQLSSEVNDASFDRMVRALDLDTVPVAGFALLQFGRIHEGLNDEQFCVLMHRILLRAEGIAVVAAVLGMRIFGRRADKLTISESLRALGREFLSKVHFERGARLDHDIGSVITVALDTPGHEIDARDMCLRLIAAVRSWKVHAWEFGETIGAITKAFPIAALDLLVEFASGEGGKGRPVLQDLRRHKANPLEWVPQQIWMAWAAQKPETRYELLADIIAFSNRGEDDPAEGWSQSAMLLIEATSKPVKVLDAFFRRFRPSGWSGSLAALMATRIPLIEILRQHPNPSIAAWAGAHASLFAQRIERERITEESEARYRDQSFE